MIKLQDVWFKGLEKSWAAAVCDQNKITQARY